MLNLKVVKVFYLCGLLSFSDGPGPNAINQQLLLYKSAIRLTLQDRSKKL